MAASEWVPVEMPMRYLAEMAATGCHDMKAFQRGPIRAIISQNGPERLWHISISCEHRYPSWEELKKTRYDLLPDEITVAMYLPPKAEYVNVHSNCFHWMEVRD